MTPRPAGGRTTCCSQLGSEVERRASGTRGAGRAHGHALRPDPDGHPDARDGRAGGDARFAPARGRMRAPASWRSAPTPSATTSRGRWRPGWSSSTRRSPSRGRRWRGCWPASGSRAARTPDQASIFSAAMKARLRDLDLAELAHALLAFLLLLQKLALAA